jgi:hypothetical protein
MACLATLLARSQLSRIRRAGVAQHVGELAQRVGELLHVAASHRRTGCSFHGIAARVRLKPKARCRPSESSWSSGLAADPPTSTGDQPSLERSAAAMELAMTVTVSRRKHTVTNARRSGSPERSVVQRSQHIGTHNQPMPVVAITGAASRGRARADRAAGGVAGASVSKVVATRRASAGTSPGVTWRVADVRDPAARRAAGRRRRDRPRRRGPWRPTPIPSRGGPTTCAERRPC